MNLIAALKYLKANPVKKGDRPEVACRSDRMNALTDAIVGLASGENVGRGANVRKKTGEGFFILSADPGGNRGSTSTTFTPFLVYPSVDNTSPPFPILKVYPGKIAGIIPTLGGASLTVLDTEEGIHPWFYPPGDSFSFFLRCKITVDPANLFRSSITEVKVASDNDADVTPDINPITNEIDEFKILWDDGITHRAGHFYIRIADITMKTEGGNIIFVDSTQWLYDNYATFAASDTEVIVLL